jgi:hypothetical protein
VTYDKGCPLEVTYDVETLKRNSWAFWFRQAAHPVTGGCDKLINSYNHRDSALWMMTVDDCYVRNIFNHFDRPDPDGYRIPYHNSQDDDWPTNGGRNLAYQQAAMMDPPDRAPIVFSWTLELTQGQQSNPVAAVNIDAHAYGGRLFQHSAHWGQPFYEMWPWYEVLSSVGSWPLGQE